MDNKQKNKALVKKYPFLKPRNVFTGKAQRGNELTYLDWMPTGWCIAFGEQMAEELLQALGKEVKTYRIFDVKEKFGGLRWYDGYGNDKTYEIIDKYEKISQTTCVICGKEATKISLGYILPYCDDCGTSKEARKYQRIKK